MQRAKNLLRQKSGETLMEGIISMLIFTLLIVTVTLMLNWSQRMTSESIRKGDEMQELADKALLDDYTDLPGTPKIPDFMPITGGTYSLTVTKPDGTDAAPILIPVTSTTFSSDEFVAFFPSTTPPVEP